MEFNLLSGLLVVIATLAIIFSIYSRKQYKSKKKEGLSLEDEISKHKELLRNRDVIIEKKVEELNLLDTNIKAKKEEIKAKEDGLKELISLQKNSKQLESNVSRLKDSIATLEKDIKNKSSNQTELEKELRLLRGNISLYTPTNNLIEVGFYEEPKYLYETSDRYKSEIQIIRDRIKTLIKNGNAINAPESIAIIEDASSAKKAIQGQIKIMLKAFNIEVDLLLLNLKPSNFAKTMERIERLATDIEKSAVSFKCGFTEEFIKLKLQECQLQYQFKLKQAAEQEEQRAIKEQMREEQKAIRDFERAIAKAQKEEQMYQDALEQAKKELDIANSDEKEKMILKVQQLEAKLKEAMENEGRAKSMAEQTKRGHVYVISNIGSFGENVYKIGMTRRLEPLDRVKELGDASVPFLFDVHAMIFSEDAPKLEKELHKVFKKQRVNMVNERKEFFNVTLDEIKAEVTKNHGDFEFTMIAKADDYRETLLIKESLAS